MNLRNISLFISLLLLLFSACRPDDLLEQEVNSDYPDWTEETHGNSLPPDYDIAFNQEEVLQFDITITSENWTAMQENLEAYIESGMVEDFVATKVPCQVRFNGIDWYEVGIYYKGKSSFDDYADGQRKISFKLDFDEFEAEYPYLKNQRFYGFKQLNLLNNEKDESLMREKVTADLFREFGVPAAETAFYKLFIDFGEGSQYFGVYTLVEEIDDTVLDNEFGEISGNLYKPYGIGSTFRENYYTEAYMGKENNVELSDYSDVFALYTVLNSSQRECDVELWKSDLEALFDVPIFLKWLAANTVIQNADSYGYKQGNYFLYNYSLTGQLTWLPWDLNKAMESEDALGLSLANVNETWPLIRFLIDDEDYYQAYKGYVAEFTSTVFEADMMAETYNMYYLMLKEAASAEEAPYTYLESASDFDLGVEELKAQAVSREVAVGLFLD